MAKKEFAPATVNFDFGFVNLKNPETTETTETVKDFVRFKVLESQRDSLIKKLPIADFATAHPGTDFWSADESMFNGVVDAIEIPGILETRNNAITVKSTMDALTVTLEDYNALNDTDKAFILIEAHKTAPGITLPKELLFGVDTEKFGKLVDSCYKAGSVSKECREYIRSMVYNIMGREDGKYFAGLAPTRAELRKGDILHVIASFGGTAKRAVKKTKDGEEITPYDYIVKGGLRAQSSAIISLIGVVMESRKGEYCKVVRG